MALRTATKVIDGVEYTCAEFGGERSFDVFLDLVDLLGPTVGAAVGSLKTQGDAKSVGDIDLSQLDLQGIVQSLLTSVSDRQRVMTFVRDKLFASTYANDQEVSRQFNTLFAGPKVWNIGKLAVFVISHNYGDFSALVGDITRQIGGRSPAAETDEAAPGSQER